MIASEPIIDALPGRWCRCAVRDERAVIPSDPSHHEQCVDASGRLPGFVVHLSRPITSIIDPTVSVNRIGMPDPVNIPGRSLIHEKGQE